MKLVVAVVQDQDEANLLSTLSNAGFQATKLASTGGFLREGNTTVLVGVEEDRVEAVLDLVRKTCRSRRQLITPLASLGRVDTPYFTEPVEVPVGGATVFVVDVERFVKV
ncbi:MAG: cyclic-di-AMP receptor [Bacillota bacterium]|nr:cyclic-di-AMP receptor [Bacillota bacterium]